MDARIATTRCPDDIHLSAQSSEHERIAGSIGHVSPSGWQRVSPGRTRAALDPRSSLCPPSQTGALRTRGSYTPGIKRQTELGALYFLNALVITLHSPGES